MPIAQMKNACRVFFLEKPREAQKNLVGRKRLAYPRFLIVKKAKEVRKDLEEQIKSSHYFFFWEKVKVKLKEKAVQKKISFHLMFSDQVTEEQKAEQMYNHHHFSFVEYVR